MFCLPRDETFSVRKCRRLTDTKPHLAPPSASFLITPPMLPLSRCSNFGAFIQLTPPSSPFSLTEDCLEDQTFGPLEELISMADNQEEHAEDDGLTKDEVAEERLCAKQEATEVEKEMTAFDKDVGEDWMKEDGWIESEGSGGDGQEECSVEEFLSSLESQRVPSAQPVEASQAFFPDLDTTSLPALDTTSFPTNNHRELLDASGGGVSGVIDGVEMRSYLCPQAFEELKIGDFEIHRQYISLDQTLQQNTLLSKIKKEKSTDCDSALIPLLCVHG